MEGEEGSRRTGELSENPLLTHLIFVKMEDIMDKLKLLNYEAGFCKKLKFKPFSRYRPSCLATGHASHHYSAGITLLFPLTLESSFTPSAI